MPLPTRPWTITTRATGEAWSLYSLEVAGGALYWRECGTGGACTLRRLAHAEQTPGTLLTSSVISAFALAHESAFVTTSTELLRLDSGSKDPTLLASIPAVVDLAVIGNRVLAVTGDTQSMEGPAGPRLPGQLISVPVHGGPITLLASHTASSPRLAADDAHAFVAEERLMSVPLQGGEALELERDNVNPAHAVAASNGWVYVVAGGELRRLSAKGGPAAVLYRARILSGVRLHAGFVYIARNLAFDRGRLVEAAAVVRLPLAGGPPELLAEVSGRLLAMAVDDAGVYVLVSPAAPSVGEVDRVLALRPPP